MNAAGQRRYSLDRYQDKSQALIKFYDGEPSYESVRQGVTLVIKGVTLPRFPEKHGTGQPSAAGALAEPNEK